MNEMIPHFYFRHLESTSSSVCGLAMLNPGWIHMRRCLETESVLLIGKRGSASIEDMGLPFEISEKNMLILPAGHVHRGLKKAEKPLSYWWFHFHQAIKLDDELRIFLPKRIYDEDVESTLSDKNYRKEILKEGIILPQSMEISNFDLISNLCGEALQAFQEADNSSLSYNNILEKILLELGKQYENSILEREMEEKSNPLVKKILEILQKELSNPNASVKYFADCLNLNADYLGRCFKKAMYMPLGQYIARRRVQLACSRLRETNSNIAKIAEECGFGSRRQFFEIFRQHVGKTPAAYRAESAYVGINAL